ncbi:MAG: helix-turn-helix transcriptional regulator [Gammaproteobacteria bacterium]|nr:helix-turn-helix transcriptional regulator [Gammaproteobacteria bacterium]
MNVSKSASLRRAEKYIQQLCCLGLDGQILIPALLEKLHDVIPSYGNAFFWTDANFKFRNLYDENPIFPQVASVYASEFYNNREREIFNTFSESMRYDRGVQSLEEVLKTEKKAFFRHDFYHLIYRPLGYRHFIRIVLRENELPLGRILLYRAEDRDFTAHERRRLAAIAPFISHALSHPLADNQIPLTDGRHEGLIITSPPGKIMFMSPQAHKLLILATHLEISPTTLSDRKNAAVLPAAVAHLGQRLIDIHRDTTYLGPPPVWRCRNAWGRFVFKAHWLNNVNPEPSTMIGITVQHQEPLPMRLLPKLERLSLSYRQSQLCLLMTSGLSYAAIAQRLNVGESTVIYHARSVFLKLNVHNRNELVNKLLEM